MELLGELGDEIHLLNLVDRRFTKGVYVSVTSQLLPNRLTVTSSCTTTVPIYMVTRASISLVAQRIC